MSLARLSLGSFLARNRLLLLLPFLIPAALLTRMTVWILMLLRRLARRVVVEILPTPPKRVRDRRRKPR